MTTTLLDEKHYEKDFSAWAEEQVHLLRQQQFTQLDTTHLIEELEELRSSTRRELISRLTVLITHLLKWQFQPSKRSRSWEVTIQVQRSDIADLLADNPSLRTQWDTFIERAWPKARKIAWAETGLDLKTFPVVCPYSAAQLMDEDYWSG